MKFHRLNSIFTIYALWIVGGFGLGLHTESQTNAVNAEFLKERKVNEIKQVGARVSAITNPETRNVEPGDRVEEAFSLGFDATAVALVHINEAFAPPGYLFKQYSDFNRTAVGSLDRRLLLQRKEFKAVIEHLDSQYEEPFIDEGIGHTFYIRDCRFCLGRTEYHFIGIPVDRKNDGRYLWMITDVDKAAEKIQTTARNALYLTTGYWALGFMLSFVQIGSSLYVINNNIRSGEQQPIPFYAPNEIKLLVEAMLEYKGGQARAESSLQKKVEELTEANIQIEAMAETSARHQKTLRHDLKVKLTSALNMVTLSANEAEGHTLSLLEIGKKALENGLAIIEQTKNFGVSSEPTELTLLTPLEIVSDLVIEYSGENKKAVSFTNENSIKILVNKVLMQRALSNLIENGFKYNTQLPDDERWVKVLFKSAKGKAAFCVQDNGDGIDPKFHEKIFEFGPESRVHNDFDDINGTGYGLSFVKDAAIAMGAEIKLESTVGKGSKFFLVFPVPENG